MKELEKAYKKMNINEYIKILKTEGLMDMYLKLLDYKNEEICTISKFNKFIIAPVYSDNETEFYGWNLYVCIGNQRILIETYDDEEGMTGAEVACNEINSIKEAFKLGVDVYVVNAN